MIQQEMDRNAESMERVGKKWIEMQKAWRGWERNGHSVRKSGEIMPLRRKITN
jgi:hypothetical protein